MAPKNAGNSVTLSTKPSVSPSTAARLATARGPAANAPASVPARTPVNRGVVDRVAGAMRALLGRGGDAAAGTLTATPIPETDGAAPMNGPTTLFGPGTPLDVVSPAQFPRALDYPTAVNQQIQPRTGEPIDFATLRGLAEASDLVRLAIETRKDQMGKLPWTIRPKDWKDRLQPGEKIVKPDTTTKAIKAALMQPDGEHDFADWFRLLLEDMLVLDAPAVYVRKTRGGKFYAFEVLDGATIARKLDDRGRTPEAPAPAYQQIIKGLPFTEFTVDELVYKPRNPRPHKIYGFSPVEQIVTTVNVAIRRAVTQIQNYTEGNIPAMLLQVPATWSPSQIAEWQAIWDALLAGDLTQKSRAKFVPDVKAERLNDAPLFDAADEWLARVICYAFSLPPTAFVHQVNRATATNAQEVALEEGLAPLMEWAERYMTRLIALGFGVDGYEFAFTDEQNVDPEVQMKVDVGYIAAGVRSPESVAAEHGWEPPPPPPVPTDPLTGQPIPVAVPAGDAKPGQPKPGQPTGAKPAGGSAPAGDKAKANADDAKAAAEAKKAEKSVGAEDPIAVQSSAYRSFVERGMSPRMAAKVCGFPDEVCATLSDVPMVAADLVPAAAAADPKNWK